MTETTVNIPLLRKAVEWAEAEAAKPWELSQWSQGDWATDPSKHTVYPSGTEIQEGWAAKGQVKSQDCGTCFCVAGYIAVEVLGDELGIGSDSERIAAQHLGIDDARASRLFHGDNTIADVRRIAESIAGERL